MPGLKTFNIVKFQVYIKVKSNTWYLGHGQEKHWLGLHA
jgi:hypothetical protein